MSISTIQELKKALASAHAEVRRIQTELNQYRMKCPGCRCRVLPGDICSCCAGSFADDEIDEMLTRDKDAT